MANRLGQVRLGGLHGLVEGFAEREVSRDRGRVGAAGPVRVRGINKLAFEDFEELAVIEDVCRAIGQQMAAFDQHIPATHPMNDLGGPPRVGQGLDLDPG